MLVQKRDYEDVSTIILLNKNLKSLMSNYFNSHNMLSAVIEFNLMYHKKYNGFKISLSSYKSNLYHLK